MTVLPMVATSFELVENVLRIQTRSPGEVISSHPRSFREEHFSSMDGLLDKMTRRNGSWRLLEEAQNSTHVVEVYHSEAPIITAATLGSVAVVSCFLSLLFVYLNRKNRVIAVAQPPFLYLICFGSLLLSVPLYFLALDEAAGLSTKQLSGFCVAGVWLRYTGFIVIYMSMFCKLWRVYRVMQFRRNQVILMKHVIWPFVVIIVATFALLIAMTIVDPPEWARVVLVDYEGDVAEYGLCSAEESQFEACIRLLMIVSILISAVMSCKTKHLPPDISDSRRICQTLWSHLILTVLGVILLMAGAILGHKFLFAITEVIVEFMIVLTTMSLMILPKMCFVWRDFGANVGGVVHISGLNNPTRSLAAAPTQIENSSEHTPYEHALAEDEEVGCTTVESCSSSTHKISGGEEAICTGSLPVNDGLTDSVVST
jgi:hypothetical protein